jgi:hypothetical protein
MGPLSDLFAVLCLEINILEEKNCTSRENPRASYLNCQKSEGRFYPVLRAREGAGQFGFVACCILTVLGREREIQKTLIHHVQAAATIK